jgi:hypothetical protein
MIDSVKITSVHLAVLIHLYYAHNLERGWLLVPMAFTIVSVALFFAQLLNEQLRRNAGFGSRAASSGSGSPLMLFLKLPHDYGMLCASFALLGAVNGFLGVYTFLLAFNVAYLSLALVKWFREMRAIDVARAA